jgi:anti-anti-sigma regulatory factor
MHSTYTIQLAVEVCSRGAVVRAAGELDGCSGPRLVRVLGAAARRGGVLVVDLAQIRWFDTAGIEALRRGRPVGVELYLTGIADRRALLPGDVAGLLDEFDMVRTAEQVLEAAPAQELIAV